ncbi:hypothetical protein PRNP1_002640 [Phytophthora ramorum]
MAYTHVRLNRHDTKLHVFFCSKEQIKTLAACAKNCLSDEVAVQFDTKIDGEDLHVGHPKGVLLEEDDHLQSRSRHEGVVHS